MDLAKGALRRSATKLKWSGEAGELAVAVRDFRAVAQQMRSLAKAQQTASESLLKYSLRQDNAAIKDTSFQVNRLFGLWGECQEIFGDELERCTRHLQALLEAGKTVEEAGRQLGRATDSEAKLRKEVDRSGRKWPAIKGGDRVLLQHKLSDATRTATDCERSLKETKAEHEVVKMYQFRAAFGQMADAYARLGTSALEIFSAQKDVVRQIPAVSTQDVTQMRYDGAVATNQRVATARQRLGLPERKQRRQSAPPGLHNHTSSPSSKPVFSTPNRGSSPPPPYAPSAPPIEDVPVCQSCHRLYPVLPGAEPHRMPTIHHYHSGGHILPSYQDVENELPPIPFALKEEPQPPPIPRPPRTINYAKFTLNKSAS